MRPRTVDVLEDILDHIGYLAEDTDGMSFSTFMSDRKTRQVVAHNLEIIGEALHRIRRKDPAVLDQISNPNQYIGLRNVLIHGYDPIDYAIIWKVAQDDVPDLEREVKALLHSAGN